MKYLIDTMFINLGNNDKAIKPLMMNILLFEQIRLESYLYDEEVLETVRRKEKCQRILIR